MGSVNAADCTLARMRVLVAPDKFKGTLTAQAAAAAVAEGWMRSRPDDSMDVLPLADGGEGTLDVLVTALGGRRVPVRVKGPLGDGIDAEIGLAEVDGVLTGIIEMARASGLGLVSPGRRDPLRASTFGTGELLVAAGEAGAHRAVVCIGGSATTDGGAGMAQAIGVRLLDARGDDLHPGGAALLELTAIDTTRIVPAVRDLEVIVASDVDNPLIGPEGAAAVFGPQKGASAEDVVHLERALTRFAEVVERDVGEAVRDRPGAGAAGGLGAGLMAFLGARIRPGIDVVMDAAGFEARMEGAGLVITGEGKLDAQSLRGKVVAGVMGLTRTAALPVIILCGRAEVRPQGAWVTSMVETFGYRRSMDAPSETLSALAERVSAGWHGIERSSELPG